MKAGFSSSLVLHAALLGFGLFTLSAPPAHDTGDVQALPVDIVPIEEITELRQGDKTASVKETPAPKQTERIDEVENARYAGDNDVDLDDVPKPAPKPRKVETAAAAPPPPPTPQVKPEPKPAEPTPPAPKPAEATPPPPPEPKPAPTPDPVAEAIEQAEPEPKPAEEQMAFPDSLPKPAARPERTQEVARAEPPKEKQEKRPEKPREDKQAQQPDDLESLLDDAKALINREKPAGGGADRSRREASLGNDRPSTASKLSASEMDALRQRLAGCWSIPAGVDDANALKVSVRFRLDRSGELEARPEVIAGGASSGPGRTAAESAVRAVQKCAPFNLPSDKYETWSEVVVNFDPSDMF